MVPKMADQLLGEVHGVGGTAPVAARQDFTTRFEGGDRRSGDPLKRILLCGHGLQRAAGVFNQLWQNGFHMYILAVVGTGAKGKKDGLGGADSRTNHHRLLQKDST